MATTYKTPGVYVEEIVKFPPSVAQVETAIPAFIGYTEKATNKIDGDLSLIPKRIASLLEYENYFGHAYPETTISVNITDSLLNGNLQRDIVVNQPSSPKPFLMYYSLQMYFANGGGPCYIVSVNTYEDTNGGENLVTFNDLDGGLQRLKSEDEPTLIVFPDAKKLGEIEFYSLYNNALAQCHDMQDRFTIIDTHTSVDSFADAKALRNRISSEKDYLKYGAAYYPYLETILDYRYNEDNILIKHISFNANAVPTALDELNNAKQQITPVISSLRTISDDNSDATNDLVIGKIPNVFEYIEDATGYDNAGAETFTVAKTPPFLLLMQDLITDLEVLVAVKKTIKNATNSAIASVEESALADDAIIVARDNFIALFEGTNKIESVLKNLKDLKTKLKSADTDAKVLNLVKSNATNVIAEVKKLLNYTPFLGLPNNALAISTDVFATMATPLLDNIITAVTTTSVQEIDKNNGAMNGRYLGDIEGLDNKSYNDIKLEISNLPLTLPPSSTIAGIYARVDSSRGVWKAPANVSINYAIKPTVKVNNNEQDSLNIDTVAGKSINAIRSFTGKGTLVWGSRTLAGNDNEWKYVPVRRFFNMAEESIKKATEQFVFEPNDANTWIRVRAMIENFLILQWRAGALAGAKPEQAFYVRVGLGQTMSAMDILDGKMIIEIGMAVVRPAEFIILRFSHKMQES
jgi:phage tail sheath protein FI